MSIKMKILPLVALAALLLCADLSFAQPGGRGGRGGVGAFFGRGNNSMSLLRMEDVQKELGMVEEQVEELEERQSEFNDEMRELFSGMRDAEDRQAFFAEMREKMEEMTKEFNDWVENDLLLDDQKRRLKQLVVQAGNRRGLHNNEALIEELGITDSQIEKMQEKAEEQEKIIQEKVAKLRAQAQEEILAILDAGQRKRIKELMGETYSFQNQQRQRGGRGGDGGRGGRGGDNGGRGGRPGGDGGRPDFS